MTEWIGKIKKNPLFRTVRVDKVVFTLLEQTLHSYLNGTHAHDIPLWQLLIIAESKLYDRGKKILRDLGNPAGLSVEATKSFVGGGSMPEQHIPSVGIVFSSDYAPNETQVAFRNLTSPILGRIEQDRFILDLRAVFESEVPELLSGIRQVLKDN
jgi:L-seryl-tRNA(Ser) seleniumtransferase